MTDDGLDAEVRLRVDSKDVERLKEQINSLYQYLLDDCRFAWGKTRPFSSWKR